MLLIAKIIGNTLAVGETVAAENLSQSGNTGADAHAQLTGFLRENDEFFCKPGAGTDDGHIANEHVDELRQFVQGGGTHKLANPRGALLIRQKLAIGITLIGHGTELDNFEGAAFASDAFLQKDGITSLEDDKQQGECEEQRADTHQANECNGKVQHALEPVCIERVSSRQVPGGEMRSLVKFGCVKNLVNHRKRCR